MIRTIFVSALSSLLPSSGILAGIILVLNTGPAFKASAAIVGTNVPAQPLTAKRIAALPPRQQAPWREYLERSQRQMKADQAAFQSELRKLGLRVPIMPPEGRSAESVPLNKPAAWYGQAEGQRIAGIVVSFQTPAGGWSKNLDMSQHPREPGERFAVGNGSRYLGPQDFDIPHDTNWNYVGTFDNDATTTQLHFLAKAIAASDADAGKTFRAAFMRGLEYVFAAQYPNGGWPQVWPLQGGYHDAITFNDDAMLSVMELLRDAAAGKGEFSFVPPQSRALAAASLSRGLQCVLAAQIVVNGRRTVWCQQHDPLTLQPASARNYEFPSAVSSESAGLVLFLMDLPEPGREEIAAVRAAAAWFERTRLCDRAVERDPAAGRRLVTAPGAPPLWARFYEIGTDRPVFGDRDKTIHDSMEEISVERRRGYGWYRSDGTRVLDKYPEWSRTHARAATLHAPKGPS
jgi:PelA/Pel-15E family pectate lyase